MIAKLSKRIYVLLSYGGELDKYILVKKIQMVHAPILNTTLILENNERFWIQSIAQIAVSGRWILFDTHIIAYYNELTELKPVLNEHLRN